MLSVQFFSIAVLSKKLKRRPKPGVRIKIDEELRFCGLKKIRLLKGEFRFRLDFVCKEDIQNHEIPPDWNEALTLLRNNWANEMVIRAFSENNDNYDSKGTKLNLRVCFRESFHAALIS